MSIEYVSLGMTPCMGQWGCLRIYTQPSTHIRCWHW